MKPSTARQPRAAIRVHYVCLCLVCREKSHTFDCNVVATIVPSSWPNAKSQAAKNSSKHVGG